MNPEFTIGNAIALLMPIAIGIGIFVRMRLDITALTIKHDAEMKALEREIADLKSDQAELTSTTRGIYRAISDLKDEMGKGLGDIRDRLTRIEAQRESGRRSNPTGRQG